MNKKTRTKGKYKGGEPNTQFQPTTKEQLKDAVKRYINLRDRSMGNIGDWDVSLITDMEGLFFNKNDFNEPLNDWDVSNVTNMNSMFSGASDFNQPLDKWNVSNVKNMSGIFSYTWKFNQPLDKWDVSNVTNMSAMFSSAITFNQPLNNWNVSKVTNMSLMFANARSFNQPLNSWNVSNVKNMRAMFSSAKKFNQPLNLWNVSNVQNMADMFKYTSSFHQNLRSWHIHASNTRNMFYYSNMHFRDFPTGYTGTADSILTLESEPEPEEEEEEEEEAEENQTNNPYNVKFHQSFTSFNSAIQSNKTPIENSTIKIKPSDVVMDFIGGEDISVRQLLERPENIIFYYQGSPSFFITREQIITNLPSLIRFGCREISTTILPRLENVEPTAYVSLRSLGFPQGGGLIPLYLLNNALYPTSLQSFCLEITETDRVFPSIASLQMLTRNPNAVSAAHCQEGQQEKVYSLQFISLLSEPTTTKRKAEEMNEQTAGRCTRKRRCTRKKRRKSKKRHYL